MEDFRHTKHNYITYHIVMTLVGYLYFQMYKNLDEGKAYAGKSLPIVAKSCVKMKKMGMEKTDKILL